MTKIADLESDLAQFKLSTVERLDKLEAAIDSVRSDARATADSAAADADRRHAELLAMMSRQPPPTTTPTTTPTLPPPLPPLSLPPPFPSYARYPPTTHRHHPISPDSQGRTVFTPHHRPAADPQSP